MISKSEYVLHLRFEHSPAQSFQLFVSFVLRWKWEKNDCFWMGGNFNYPKLKYHGTYFIKKFTVAGNFACGNTAFSRPITLSEWALYKFTLGLNPPQRCRFCSFFHWKKTEETKSFTKLWNHFHHYAVSGSLDDRWEDAKMIQSSFFIVDSRRLVFHSIIGGLGDLERLNLLLYTLSVK